jgi:predicted permease
MSEPPRFAEWLLRRLVGGRDADAVAGDLRETLEARGGGRLWYWRQAVSCMAVRFSLYRRSLPGIGTDFSRALRRIRRNPGYALTAVLCLALALGVNTTLFSFLDSRYFRRLPVPGADRIVSISRERASFCTSRQYFAIRNSLHTINAAAVMDSGDPLELGRLGLSAWVESVSPNYPEVLGLGTVLGRWFGQDSASAAEPPVVISYRFWKTRFGGDPEVLGKQIRIVDKFHWVVGVAPAQFAGTIPPMVIDLWVPLRAPGGRATVNLVARLAPGATLANAAAEIRVIAARLRASDPRNDELASPPLVEPHMGFVWRFQRNFFLPVLTLLSAVSGIVLLIACVNVANLLLSRAAVRQREMAVRQSLGASRARLFRETLAEGLVLAAGGLALGIFLGYWTGRTIELVLPSVPYAMYRGLRLGIDWRVAMFLAAAGALCAVLFSLPPAFANSRGNLSPSMKGVDARNSRQREIYSVAQVALSLTLLIATGLLLRALDRVQHIDPGFAYDHRAYISLRDEAQNPTLFSTLLDQARQIPGVEGATAAWGVFPNTGGGCAAVAHGEKSRDLISNLVDPSYFDLMRIPIVKGSGFAPSGSFTNAPQVIVNEAMARAFWPGQDPLGKRLWFGPECTSDGKEAIGTVIGVARDAKLQSLGEQPEPLYYLSRFEDRGNGFYSLIVRTTGDPREWVQPLVSLVERNGGNVRIYKSGTLDAAVAESLWEVKWQASLLGAIGLLAIVLASIGVYGVVACAVAQRTREIGVRMALGAVPLDVQWMVLAHGLRITAIGIAVGLLLSAFTVRLLRGFLYGLSPFDPVAFAGASLAWIVIAIFASWYPARRATRVDPMTALNYE